ncbi:hypothetical protein Mgra_00001322 [Meloidogyne graminicola]|uniref:Uncharacterized protein n=1 Tax=Meloidogyne graminicola TaxID=189291 RepID=A0A8T0A0L8_9BILA|nr:hypothetical protein Mgra_00001322 [Meloidogyne graminicola]
MRLKIFFTFIFFNICTLDQNRAEIPSSLLSGIVPEGVPHGPPGSFNEETSQSSQILTKAPSEEDVIGSLLKNPGLPPALPINTGSVGNNNPLSNNNEQTSNKDTVEDQNNNQKGQIDEETQAKTGSGLPLPPSMESATSIPEVHGEDENSEVLPPASPPSYIQCLHRIQSKVCDPDNILVQSQRSEIDEMLKELEDATRKENTPNECDRNGLEVMVIIVQHSNLLDNLESVQKKLSDALNIWVQDTDHRCEKPLILMISADKEISNRKVWTGRSSNVPVEPSELVKLFIDQVSSYIL